MRAPWREAFVKSWSTTIARLSSIIPTTSVRNTGMMKANSTMAAPRRDDGFRCGRLVMIQLSVTTLISRRLFHEEDRRVNVEACRGARVRIGESAAGVAEGRLHRQVLAAHRTGQVDITNPHAHEVDNLVLGIVAVADDRVENGNESRLADNRRQG